MDTSTQERANELLALSNDMANAVEQVSQAVVAVNARPRVATSGVLWRQGIVVATDHTIKREEDITLTLHDGRTIPATLAGRDPGTDLAILKFEDAAATAADLSDSAASPSVRVGHLVLAVGRTGGDGVSASLGIISSVGDAWRTWRGGQLDKFIKLDLSIYTGFSGSPLVSADGRILGINTSALARGAGLTIPASTVNRVVDELLARGRVTRAYIGVGMHPVRLPETLKNSLNLSGTQGVIVLSVEPGGPADAAGLLIGDVLVALDDRHVTNTDDVQGVLTPERVGQTAKAMIIRGGAKAELTLTIGERPSRKGRK